MGVVRWQVAYASKKARMGRTHCRAHGRAGRQLGGLGTAVTRPTAECDVQESNLSLSGAIKAVSEQLNTMGAVLHRCRAVSKG